MSMRQLKISASITNRESESLEKYLREINKVDLISVEEEIRLAVLIRLGDQKAADKLVKANLRFVVSVAKQFQHQGLSLSDLINEGNIGLIKAAKMYDETKGFKFISYAIWWIRQSILQSIAEHAKIIRIPINRVNSANRIGKAFNHLEQQLEREPSAEEIAEYLNIDITEIREGFERRSKDISLDSPVSVADEGTLIDVMENTNAEKADKKMDTQSLSKEIERSLKALPQIQQYVICYSFGIGIDRPVSLEEIASRLNLTRERIRQIKEKAIAKLRSNSQSNLLKAFMGN